MEPKIHLHVLASGSKGNAAVVEGPTGSVLIDCGLSLRELRRRADELGANVDDLEAVLVTHEHADHSAVQQLRRRARRDHGHGLGALRPSRPALLPHLPRRDPRDRGHGRERISHLARRRRPHRPALLGHGRLGRGRRLRRLVHGHGIPHGRGAGRPARRAHPGHREQPRQRDARPRPLPRLPQAPRGRRARPPLQRPVRGGPASARGPGHRDRGRPSPLREEQPPLRLHPHACRENRALEAGLRCTLHNIRALEAILRSRPLALASRLCLRCRITPSRAFCAAADTTKIAPHGVGPSGARGRGGQTLGESAGCRDTLLRGSVRADVLKHRVHVLPAV